MAAPLPGFLPGTLQQSEHGTSPGFGQVVPSLEISEYVCKGTNPLPLLTTFQTLVDRTSKNAVIVDALNVGDVGGAGSTVTVRLRPYNVTPAGTEYNLVTAFAVGAGLLKDLFTALSSVVVPADYVLELSAGVAAQLNATASYRESRHQ